MTHCLTRVSPEVVLQVAPLCEGCVAPSLGAREWPWSAVEAVAVGAEGEGGREGRRRRRAAGGTLGATEGAGGDDGLLKEGGAVNKNYGAPYANFLHLQCARAGLERKGRKGRRRRRHRKKTRHHRWARVAFFATEGGPRKKSPHRSPHRNSVFRLRRARVQTPLPPPGTFLVMLLPARDPSPTSTRHPSSHSWGNGAKQGEKKIWRWWEGGGRGPGERKRGGAGIDEKVSGR